MKIIDTKKFALTPGLSPAELREEAEMMRVLDHVGTRIVPQFYSMSDSFDWQIQCLQDK